MDIPMLVLDGVCIPRETINKIIIRAKEGDRETQQKYRSLWQAIVAAVEQSEFIFYVTDQKNENPKTIIAHALSQSATLPKSFDKLLLFMDKRPQDLEAIENLVEELIEDLQDKERVVHVLNHKTFPKSPDDMPTPPNLECDPFWTPYPKPLSDYDHIKNLLPDWHNVMPAAGFLFRQSRLLLGDTGSRSGVADSVDPRIQAMTNGVVVFIGNAQNGDKLVWDQCFRAFRAKESHVLRTDEEWMRALAEARGCGMLYNPTLEWAGKGFEEDGGDEDGETLLFPITAILADESPASARILSAHHDTVTLPDARDLVRYASAVQVGFADPPTRTSERNSACWYLKRFDAGMRVEARLSFHMDDFRFLALRGQTGVPVVCDPRAVLWALVKVAELMQAAATELGVRIRFVADSHDALYLRYRMQQVCFATTGVFNFYTALGLVDQQVHDLTNPFAKSECAMTLVDLETVREALRNSTLGIVWRRWQREPIHKDPFYQERIDNQKRALSILHAMLQSVKNSDEYKEVHHGYLSEDSARGKSVGEKLAVLVLQLGTILLGHRCHEVRLCDLATLLLGMAHSFPESLLSDLGHLAACLSTLAGCLLVCRRLLLPHMASESYIHRMVDDHVSASVRARQTNVDIKASLALLETRGTHFLCSFMERTSAALARLASLAGLPKKTRETIREITRRSMSPVVHNRGFVTGGPIGSKSHPVANAADDEDDSSQASSGTQRSFGPKQKRIDGGDAWLDDPFWFFMMM